ncbi:MAG: glutamine-hydrolyzing GMP synthase [Caldisphaeraceae archaeon]|nr:glutamine-hydrolyzing GMP synthase [Caldisphaeraceae archaeon]
MVRGLSYVSIVDLGSQYTHLIQKRLTYLGLRSVLTPWFTKEVYDSDAVIISGSPMSSLRDDISEIKNNIVKIINQGKPILGICFGNQILAEIYGGKIVKRAEYGRTRVSVDSIEGILKGFNNIEEVWMSHSDCVIDAGDGKVLSLSENGCVSAVKIPGKPVYGVQFHPEVTHTKKGDLIFKNFAKISGMSYKEISVHDKVSLYYQQVVDEIRSMYKGGRIISAVSGGVDSTVSTYITMKVVGPENVIPVFINHGFFRDGEVEDVLNKLKAIGIDPIYIDASREFIEKTMNIVSCEDRRKTIGELFARKLFEVIKEKEASYLIQGTTYPDLIESGRTRHSRRIKSHHNVAGLPEWFNIQIIEPLKGLYKDEIRELGKILGLPREIIRRHPFPGPGLAVRIIGKLTPEKLEIARKADRILNDVLKREGIYEKLWQALAVVSESWVGVKGDEREEGYIVSIRLLLSEDGMTADYYLPEKRIVDEIARKITNNVENVTAVSFVTTTKPPATIEPC